MGSSPRSFARRAPAGAGIALAAFLAWPGAPHASGYPLAIENCGVEVTFAQAPRRAVTLGQNSAEILLSLGLADRMAGTAVWVGPVLAGLEEANAGVDRIADNQPSFEAVLNAAPDFVAAQFTSDIGPQGRVGTRGQFAELGVATYVSPSDCIGKDDAGGGDGSRSTPFSMELIYREIDELARIFGVPDRGDALVAGLKAREEAVVDATAGRARDVSLVYWFSSARIEGDPWIAGRNGAPGYITKKLGAVNVVDTEEEWPAASWESIVGADPDVIVIGTMDRRRYPADDPAAKIRFLEEDPVTSRLDAVRDRRFVMMDAQSMNPTIRTIDGLEKLAEALDGFGLLK
jgi:iron complex transport system substrate-binding protein